MGVAAWGFGTGSTGGTARSFNLSIQGTDYIDYVPMESVSVNQSVSSNATLTFTIFDAAGTLDVPTGWADVTFTENRAVGEAEVIFGGLVMGTTVRLGAGTTRYIDVRCVDYGVLLDVAPLGSAVVVGPSGHSLYVIMQQIAGVAPLGGITATTYNTGRPGRITALIDEDVPGTEYSIPLAVGTSETIDTGTMARTALDQYAALNEDPFAIVPRPADVYVTPLKQLAIRPSDKTFGAAPLGLDVAPGLAEIAADEIALDTDWRPLETGVYIEDGDRIEPGVLYQGNPIDSGWYRGTVNGYTVIPNKITVPLPDAAQIAIEGRLYLEQHEQTVAGSATVTTTYNFVIGTSLAVNYPAAGVTGTYAIHAVSTKFLGGLQRSSTIQFGGEVRTVSRLNRSRFVRAGILT